MKTVGATSKLDSALRVVAATVLTLPIALLASAVIARFLPLDESVRFAVGYIALVPLWITAMCCAFLARSGARSCVSCLLLSAALALLVYVA